jgi:hypothetical protein
MACRAKHGQGRKRRRRIFRRRTLLLVIVQLLKRLGRQFIQWMGQPIQQFFKRHLRLGIVGQPQQRPVKRGR